MKRIILKDGTVISTDSKVEFLPNYINFSVNKDASAEYLFNLALVNKCDVLEFPSSYLVIIKKEQVEKIEINNQ